MKRRPSVLIIFLTVFIDLVGFGIIVPLVPVFSKHYGAGPLMLGVIGASYSAMQFVFAPIWGRLSDRYGRRPVLLLSTAGAAVSYVFFALGSGLANPSAALWVLLAARAFAGACGGNITVAQAYIADITPPENRSRRMGLIGMAFGLGFILGPVIGGLSYKGIPGLGFHGFGPTGPGWVAASICVANLVLAFMVLAESHKPSTETAGEYRPHLKQWRQILARPRAGLLILIFFLATFAFSCFEFTLPLLVSDNFHLEIEKDPGKPATTVISCFVFCGLISAFIQGGAIGRLVKKFGESKLIAISLFLTGISLALLPFIHGEGPLSWSRLFQSDGWPWMKMLFALALLSLGSSLTRPPVFGLLSNLTPPHEQGATIGVAQSAGSLARIFGPLFAATAYAWTPALPYVVCGVIAIAAGVLVIQKLHDAQGAPVTGGAPVG